MPIFIQVTKAEEDEDYSPPFFAVEKLIRVSDIRDIDELELEEEDWKIEGSLINFYDGDSIIVLDSLEELHLKIEGK